MLFLGNLTGLTGFLVILGWWMSCFLIGWLKTKKSIHWLICVVEGISANSPVLLCVAGNFCLCDFRFWFLFIRTRGCQTKKRWGRGRGRERERENLRLLLLLPPPTFSGLTSVQLSRGCISYFANGKKPPATQAAPLALNHYLVT